MSSAAAEHSPFNWVWSQNKETPKSINPHSIFYGGKSRNWFEVFAIAWNVTTLIAAQENVETTIQIFQPQSHKKRHLKNRYNAVIIRKNGVVSRGCFEQLSEK